MKGQENGEEHRREGERGPPLAGRHTQANTSDASYQLLTEWIVLRKAEKVPGGFRRPENALCPPKPFCSWVYQGIYREVAREPPKSSSIESTNTSDVELLLTDCMKSAFTSPVLMVSTFELC